MALQIASTTETPEQMAESLRMFGYEPETPTEDTPEPAAPAEVQASEEGKTAAEPGAADTDTQESSDKDKDAARDRNAKGEFTTPPPSKGVQKRIDELTRERYEEKGRREAIETRNAQLEAELAELKKQSAAKPADEPQPKPEVVKPVETRPKPVRPKLETFETTEDYEAASDQYLEDLTDWKAEQREAKLEAQLAALKTELSKTATDATTQELERAERHAAYNERLEATMAAHSDYAEVMAGPAKDLKVSPAMVEAMADYADQNLDTEIAFHLMQHPEECEALFKATMYDPAKATPQQVLAINRKVGSAIALIARDLKPPKTASPASGKPDTPAKSDKVPAIPKDKVTKAPEPIVPVRGASSASTKSPETMTGAEYRAHLRTAEGRAWYLAQGFTDQDLKQFLAAGS